MKKNFKQRLTLLLAIIMVATSAIYLSGAALKVSHEGIAEVPEGKLEQRATNGETITKGYTIHSIEDTEIPLANMDLDDHAGYGFYFLLILPAALALIFYVKDMRKRQARILELRKELNLKKQNELNL